jgi:hypothetical protein
MPTTVPWTIPVANGDLVTLWGDDEGNGACPICGHLSPGHRWEFLIGLDWAVPHTGCICPCCWVQHDYDTFVDEHAPAGFLARLWVLIRYQFLAKRRWDERFTRQIIENLHVTREELEALRRDGPVEPCRRVGPGPDGSWFPVTPAEICARVIIQKPGATEEALAAAERALGLALPDALRELLLFADGFEGFVGPRPYGVYLRLLPAAEVASRPAEPKLIERPPTLVLFARHAAGQGYFFDPARDGCPVREVSLAADPAHRILDCAPSVGQFFARLCAGHGPNDGPGLLSWTYKTPF